MLVGANDDGTDTTGRVFAPAGDVVGKFKKSAVPIRISHERKIPLIRIEAHRPRYNPHKPYNPNPARKNLRCRAN